MNLNEVRTIIIKWNYQIEKHKAELQKLKTEKLNYNLETNSILCKSSHEAQFINVLIETLFEFLLIFTFF